MKIEFKIVEKQKWIRYKVYALIPAKKYGSAHKNDTIYDVKVFFNINDAIAYSKELIKKYSGIPGAKFILVKDTNNTDIYDIYSMSMGD